MKTQHVQLQGNVIRIGGTGYQVSQINSVKVRLGRRANWSVAIGLFCAGAAATGATDSNWAGASVWGVVAVILLARGIAAARKHQLILTTSSGEIAALESSDAQLLEAVAEDVLGAMSVR